MYPTVGLLSCFLRRRTPDTRAGKFHWEMEMSYLQSPGSEAGEGLCCSLPGRWKRPGAGTRTLAMRGKVRAFHPRGEGREAALPRELVPAPCACGNHGRQRGAVLLAPGHLPPAVLAAHLQRRALLTSPLSFPPTSDIPSSCSGT